MFEAIQLSRQQQGGGSNWLLCDDASTNATRLATFAGQVQAVYIDPPFMTGEVFSRRRRFGTAGWRSGRPMAEFPAYADCFDNRESYLDMLRALIVQAKMLLKDTGVFYLHLDWRTSAYARVLCDEIFGEDMFLNEIIWSYESGGRSKKFFSRKHDTILLYAKTKDVRFDLRRVPLSRTDHRKNHMRRCVDEDGRTYSQITTGGKVYRYYDDAPVYPGDVWTDISHLQQRDPERTGYPTQKPLKLLERLLLPVVNAGDLVADLCCGSGTAMEAAQKLGCHFIGVDKSPEAILSTAARVESDNLSLECPCTLDDATLEGEYTGDGGMLLLTGFHTTHENFPATEQQFDTLESWGVGEIHGNTLHIVQQFQRTRKTPELPRFCVLPSGMQNIAVATVDAAGRRRVFRWTEEK